MKATPENEKRPLMKTETTIKDRGEGNARKGKEAIDEDRDNDKGLR